MFVIVREEDGKDAFRGVVVEGVTLFPTFLTAKEGHAFAIKHELEYDNVIEVTVNKVGR